MKNPKEPGSFPSYCHWRKGEEPRQLAMLSTFRKHNLENLQMRLAEQGLSSLGRLEGHVIKEPN
ncbi:MAG: hypothetical protein WA395_14510 [Nitrososphaeraceae archaeon]